MGEETQTGPLIGVLALQGSVEEHVDVLTKLGARTREIRTKDQVAGVDGLVFPGGESTAMGAGAARRRAALKSSIGRADVRRAAGERGRRRETDPRRSRAVRRGAVATAHRIARSRTRSPGPNPRGPGTGSVADGRPAAIETRAGIMSEGDGLFEALRASVASGTPAYGTCAGMILLADDCVGQREGGQALVGGLRCTVCRNYFGAQVSSFELPLAVEGGDDDAARLEASEFPAVFIRAPAILARGEGCEALASVKAAPCAAAAPEVDAFRGRTGSKPASKKRKADADDDDETPEVCVAARQGPILVTAFHPELTDDLRWHDLFLGMVKKKLGTA